jgi:hypothetical protein
MGVSVKAEWIESYNAEQRRRKEDERGRRIERGLLLHMLLHRSRRSG